MGNAPPLFFIPRWSSYAGSEPRGSRPFDRKQFNPVSALRTALALPRLSIDNENNDDNFLVEWMEWVGNNGHVGELQEFGPPLAGSSWGKSSRLTPARTQDARLPLSFIRKDYLVGMITKYLLPRKGTISSVPWNWRYLELSCIMSISECFLGTSSPLFLARRFSLRFVRLNSKRGVINTQPCSFCLSFSPTKQAKKQTHD